MENQGHSGTQKTSNTVGTTLRPLFLYTNIKDFHFEIPSEVIIFPLSDFDQSQNFIMIKETSNNKIEVSFFYNNKINKFKSSVYNLKKIFSDTYHLISQIPSQESILHIKRKERLESKLEKTLDRFNYVLNANQLLNSEQKKTISETTHYEELLDLAQRLSSLNTFPKDLLSLKCFRNFQYSQIITLEKGKSSAQSFFFDVYQGSSSSRISTTDFNHLFNLVKKSKHKHFDQSTNNSDIISSMGIFLAKEFSFKEHNYIIIVSRNDFIPCTKEEIKEFEQIIDILAPFINTGLKKVQEDAKTQQLVQIFEQLNLHIAITDNNNKFIFKNSYFDTANLKEKNSEYLFLPIDDGKKVIIKKNQDESIVSDLHHHHRVLLLGELLNTLRHELNNPLFGIKMAAEILSQDAKDSDTQESFLEISKYSNRCQTIIQNFSELYSDNVSTSIINLKKLINETLLLTKSEIKQIRYNIYYKGFENDNVSIETNPVWLTQILFNLIINAGQAIKLNDEDLKNHYINLYVNKSNMSVTFTVEDSGPGIDSKIFDTIFKPFFTTKDSGTGLGLAICKNLARKLKTTISYSNRASGGTIFSFTLDNILK